MVSYDLAECVLIHPEPVRLLSSVSISLRGYGEHSQSLGRFQVCLGFFFPFVLCFLCAFVQPQVCSGLCGWLETSQVSAEPAPSISQEYACHSCATVDPHHSLISVIAFSQTMPVDVSTAYFSKLTKPLLSMTEKLPILIAWPVLTKH